MPIQTRPLTQPANTDIENSRLPDSYFVDKGLAANGDGDLRLQETIWSFLGTVPEIELSEIEVDVSNGTVTLMGTFPNSKMHGRILHHVMHLDGVQKVIDQTHVLSKHPQMNSSNSP